MFDWKYLPQSSMGLSLKQAYVGLFSLKPVASDLVWPVSMTPKLIGPPLTVVHENKDVSGFLY